MKVEARLEELGLELPAPPPAAGNYVGAVRVGELLFLSGHGPVLPEGGLIIGKVGRDLDEEQGYEAARRTALSMLATLKHQLGNLDRVRRIVKVLGFVNCTDDFTKQPKVINGFSDLFVELYGDAGRHARSAVGKNSLPFGMAVEIEMIAQV
jgi:enamine deaminase RidA (YjgF/YER057c/UK114 family)